MTDPNISNDDSSSDDIPYPSHEFEFRSDTQLQNVRVKDTFDSSIAIQVRGNTRLNSDGCEFYNGTGDTMRIDPDENPGPTWLMGGIFTIEMDILNIGGQNWHRYFEVKNKSNSDNHKDSIMLRQYKNDLDMFQVNGIANYDNLISRENNVFTHIVVTYNTATATTKVYKNGSIFRENYSQRAQMDRVMPRQYMSIGCRADNNGNRWRGKMKFIRVWQGIDLNSDQISTLYNNRDTKYPDIFKTNMSSYVFEENRLLSLGPTGWYDVTDFGSLRYSQNFMTESDFGSYDGITTNFI